MHSLSRHNFISEIKTSHAETQQEQNAVDPERHSQMSDEPITDEKQNELIGANPVALSMANLEIYRQRFIANYVYPADMMLAQYTFEVYLLFSLDVMGHNDDLSLQEALHWIRADFAFQRRLISDHAEAQFLADNDFDDSVPVRPDRINQGPNQTQTGDLAGNNLDCALCGVKINCHKTKIAHEQGKQHKKKLQPMIEDEVCGTKFLNQTLYETHLKGDKNKHLIASAWHLGKYFLYCHLCKRFPRSDAQTHSWSDKHQELLRTATRTRPNGRKWIQFCTGVTEDKTPVMRAQFATVEQICAVYPDFIAREYDGESPSYSPDEDYDEGPRRMSIGSENDESKDTPIQVKKEVSALPADVAFCGLGENCRDVFLCALRHTPEEYKQAHVESMKLAEEQLTHLRRRNTLYKNARAAYRYGSGSSSSPSSGSSSSSSSSSSSGHATASLPPQVFKFADDTVYRFGSLKCVEMVSTSKCQDANCTLDHGISNSKNYCFCKNYNLGEPCQCLWEKHGCNFNHGRS